MKTSEERLETKYVRNLRKQIIKLKRENALLRKKNNRLEVECFMAGEVYENENCETNQNVEYEKLQKDNQTCPKCGSYSVEEFSLGTHDFWRCDNCESKGHRESEISEQVV